ncbi:MAG TPA: P-loop NTPase fold protein [Allosphingosinicella sp.]|nr:P-loop NTPase fold protein [Allosphingosinicella sp.]
MGNIQGDRALSKDGIDRLGFKGVAERLAEALSLGVATAGLVIGVLGRWGSGKTSLLNLTQAAIEARDLPNQPHVVEFRPWLVGDRDSLLRALFAEIASGIDRIEHDGGDATGVSVRAARKAGDAVREFASNLGGVGKVTKTAGLVVPWLGTIGAFVSDVADAASKKNVPSLSTLKDTVSRRLKRLPRPLVVLIDDVDRLEPREVVEVLRLVRSVADFPNITYVLGYDVDKVAHAVEVAANVDDGHAYVEKIVQITVPVPIPEAFDLRRWFESELSALHTVTGRPEARRIAEIIDREGGRYLVSPRAVIRTLDSIRFCWSAVKGQVDFSDFVWLQFVKVGNPALYDWIAIYLTEMAARSSGRVSISEDAIIAARAKLDEVLEREGQTFNTLSDRLSEFLPGIDEDFLSEGEQTKIYGRVAEEAVQRAVNQRRLASPITIGSISRSVRRQTLQFTRTTLLSRLRLETLRRALRSFFPVGKTSALPAASPKPK